MRLFLALNLPAAKRAEIYRATAVMRDAVPAARWVKEDGLHLTLKFFGEQPDEAATALAAALRDVAAASPLIALRLHGLGAFPNLRAPRVVWLGVDPDPRLELLHHGVETACGALGYDVEGRAFRPHVTLARLKEAIVGAGAKALAAAARKVTVDGTIDVRTLDLMASQMSPRGPRYTVVAALPFGGS